MKKKGRISVDLDEALKRRSTAKYVLKLYVAGITRKSSTAIRSVTDICEQYLKDRYSLEIIDIYQNPTLAKGEQIIAAPTLIKELPSPLRKLIGDMADKDKVLLGLDLKRIDDEKNASPQRTTSRAVNGSDK